MSAVRLVATFVENKPGQTARITKVLAAAKINIRCVTVASSGAYGVMKLLVNDPAEACHALKHENLVATLVDVLAVEIPDRPGALFAIANCLAQHNINLDNTSGFVVNNRAILVLEVHNVPHAAEILAAQGLHVLDQKETLAI